MIIKKFLQKISIGEKGLQNEERLQIPENI